MPKLIVGIDQYSYDLYTWLRFGYENLLHLLERFVVFAILWVEKQWTKVRANAITYSEGVSTN